MRGRERGRKRGRKGEREGEKEREGGRGADPYLGHLRQEVGLIFVRVN